MVIPYVVFFLVFVVWPVAYGRLARLRPGELPDAVRRPDLTCARPVNTVVFLGVGINLKLFLALLLSGFFAVPRPLDPLAQRDLHPAVGGAVDPDHLLVPLDAELRVGDAQRPALGRCSASRGRGGWSSPHLAFGSVIFVHIWKYLPFWTLILLAGRMAIPTDLYEAATHRRRLAAAEVHLRHLAAA